MKTLSIILPAIAIVAFACTPNNINNQSSQAVSNLENFVDSMDTEISQTAHHNWTVVEREYVRLQGQTKAVWNSATDSEKEKVQNLEAEYKELKASAQRNADDFSAEANRHLKHVENWMQRSATNMTDGITKAGEAVEEGAEESMDWLERHYEQLEEGTKRQYDNLKSSFNNNKS